MPGLRRRTVNDVRRIRVFVSSPGDVALEREQARDVVAELNATAARELGLALEAVAWENEVHPSAGRWQATINRQIGAYDVFVGIMWRRYGTPTGEFGSGTEEEFLAAYDEWRRTGSPKLMFYFCEAPSPESEPADAPEQLERVLNLRRRLEADLPLLYGVYDDRERFDRVLRRDLYRLLVDEFGGGPPLDRRVRSVLDLQKEQARELDVRFMTPHLLLALLQMNGGFAQRGFDGVRPGLAAELRRTFATYVSSDAARANEGFSDFVWEEHENVRRARRLAAEANALHTDDRHLLLAVFGGDSNTVVGLRRQLGDDAFEALVDRVESLPAEGPVGVVRTYDPFGEDT